MSIENAVNSTFNEGIRRVSGAPAPEVVLGASGFMTASKALEHYKATPGKLRESAERAGVDAVFALVLYVFTACVQRFNERKASAGDKVHGLSAKFQRAIASAFGATTWHDLWSAELAKRGIDSSKAPRSKSQILRTPKGQTPRALTADEERELELYNSVNEECKGKSDLDRLLREWAKLEIAATPRAPGGVAIKVGYYPYRETEASATSFAALFAGMPAASDAGAGESTESTESATTPSGGAPY